MKIKNLLFVLALTLSSSAVFAADATLATDNQSINTACTADAQTAGCGSDKVGGGLLKCLHAYKVAHPGTKYSAGCVTAMKQRHADKKAGK